MNTVVHVVPVDAALRSAVLALAVHPEQLPFVGRASDSLADVAVCPDSVALALLHDEVVVGYVRIDRRATALADHPLAAGSVALRSFLIDASRQGQGLGGAALEAIRAYVAWRHADRERIVLGVNVGNAAALRLYRRAGYREGGGLYHGGRAGPQYVLWRPLSPTND